MTREELTVLRDAIDMTLALPDSVRELLAQWLTPATSKPNGRDLHPPVPSPPPKAAPTPRPADAKPHDNPAHARAPERRLLAVMRDHPGLSVIALANAVNAGRSATGERLRRLAAQDLIEKDRDGHWRVKAEKPRPELLRETNRAPQSALRRRRRSDGGGETPYAVGSHDRRL
jgi:hypothetical protein